MGSARLARWSASRHPQILAALLALLVASPFTAPVRVCRSPQVARAAGSHVHQRSAPRSAVVRAEADAAPLAPPPSVAEDPLKEDALLPDGHSVTVIAAHVSAAPPLATGRGVLRPVVATLRL
jgi:hypothetical protein